MSKLAVKIDGKSYAIELDLLDLHGAELAVNVDGQTVRVVLPENYLSQAGLDWIVVDDRPYELHSSSDLNWIKDQLGVHTLELQDLDSARLPPAVKDGRVIAPIPGLISLVLVQPGQQVKAGQAVVILEAMKMFNELLAPVDGMVKSIHVCAGQTVAKGELVVDIERNKTTY